MSASVLMDVEGSPRDARLAIRTIVVTTRAAVSTHLADGQRGLAERSVWRGLGLLDRLGDRLDGDAGATLEHARAELEGLRASVSEPTPERLPH